MKNHLQNLVLVPFFLIVFTNYLNGQHNNLPELPPYFNFHPDIGSLYIGDCFDAINPSNGKGSAIESYQLDSTNKGKVLGFNFDLYVVRSEQAVKELFSLDASISVRHPIGNVSLDFDYSKNYTASSQSVTFCLTASKEYMSYKIKNGSEKLSADADSLLKSSPPDYDLFRYKYGTHYITALNTGIKLFAFFTIELSNSSMQRSLSASLKGQGRFGLVKVSADVNMKNMFEEAVKYGKVTINIKGYGSSENFDNLSKTIESENNYNYEKLQNIIRDELKDYDPQNAVPVKLYYKCFSNFGWGSTKRNEWTSAKEKRLIEINEKYWQLASLKNYIANVIYNQTDLTKFIRFSPYKDSLSRAHERIEDYLESLSRVFDKCLSDTPCVDLSCCVIPKLNLSIDDIIPKIYAIKIGGVYDDVRLGTNFVEIYQNIVMAPIIKDHLKNLRVIRYDKDNTVNYVIVFFQNFPDLIENKTEIDSVIKKIDFEFTNNSDERYKNYPIEILDIEEISPLLEYQEVDIRNNPQLNYINHNLIYFK